MVFSMPRRGVKVSLRREATLTPLPGHAGREAVRRRGDGLLTSGSGIEGGFNYHKNKKGLTRGTNIEADIHHFGKLPVPRLTNFRMAHDPDDLLRGQVHALPPLSRGSVFGG